MDGQCVGGFPGSHYEIRPGEVKLHEKIGEGSFGKVYRGKCRGHEVAIKVLLEDITDQESLASFKAEIKTMASFSHSNIVLFLGACTQPGNFFIVQELMYNDVEKLLRSGRQIPLWKRMVMARDAAAGINWLHGSNFIHRDLKTSNLLLDSSGHVKVCDFGLSQVKSKGKMLKDDKARGTPIYMAPEVIQCKKYNEKADVYSFGIILWEFLTRQQPFVHHQGERPLIPPDTETSLQFLIEECWLPDPLQRPIFSIILQRLNHIIIDLACKDSQGRAFWKKNFLSKEEVEWQKFAISFDVFLQIPGDDELTQEDAQRINLNFKCFKAILEPSEGHPSDQLFVSLENFGEFCQWFGPIVIPKQPTIELTILDHVRCLMNEKWFFGRVDTDTAEQKLRGRPDGTFLVRFSSKMPGWYTISFVHQSEIFHTRIEHSPGKPFICRDESFDSLFDLVQKKNLTLACEGSPFYSIFHNKAPNYR